jgi:tetratricopeptide (TPR) repeat protein
MAFGFGFNKAKVLSSAEKFVQQGKLHNAITEYEKIVEKDARDLTVLNTIGDLYARLGQTEKAGEYFKKVGDTYAGDGFTVKAIAMYKKLTKLNVSNISVVQRLAELYTQQGLYNDARQQYLHLAEGCVKNNDLPGAAKVFQKMLEIDPDNTSLQSKLADLYVRMGKKDEARDIYMRAATSLYDRGSVEQADQALDRMMALDPANGEALMMRGKIALEAGDGAAAARFFEKVPNIDSKPEGLQQLLKAQIITNNAAGAEAVARKLASVHNDLSGMRSYADFLLTNGNAEGALNVYDEFADRLLLGDTGELMFTLQGLTGQLKDSPPALEKLRNVFQKADATGNVPEVNELLAHAYVKTGELAKARDLYKELAELEPSNPLHMQNYRQVMGRLGEDSAARPFTPTEASQAFFVEEIQAPPVDQEYEPALKEEIDTVLSEAELFESYNKHAQAVGPLEALLAKAPTDARINQRLVSVYQKLGRSADAARCCETLQGVYERFGISKQAKQYGEMAAKFREQAGPAAVAEAAAPAFEVASAVSEMPVESVQEFTTEAFGAAAATEAERPAVPVAGEAHEIDLSAEWEAALTEQPAEAAPVAETPAELAAAPSEFEVATPETQPSVAADLLEEIRFYLSHSMWDEARSAISRCEQAEPASLELADLRQQLESATAAAAAPPAVEPMEVEVEAPAAEAVDATISEFDFDSGTAAPADAAIEEAQPSFEVSAPAAEMAVETTTPEVFAEEPMAAEEFSAPEFSGAEFSGAELEAAIPTAPETALGEAVPARDAAAEEVVPAEVAEEPEPAAVEALATDTKAAEAKDVLSDMVLDLESALGDDFGAPAPKPIEMPAPEPAPQIAAAAVASASAPATPIAAAAPAPLAQAAAPPVEMTQSETSSVLSDLFEEFKEEVGEPAEEAEDPETHYNLGVAFKEMGLLDEAIGELQKVCNSIDKGSDFSQVMQAYTWLASCFVEKGVPEASVKWYEKALSIPSSTESRTALHYDLAAAYEAAGDKRAALKHFTEVYGTNIDYRDVAQRIKTLKS